MGCAASRLDNEDTVRRCKERRRLMKEAVYSRHHLASAHADYLRSLLLTGSALTRFAAGEPLSVSEQTPPVFLHHYSAAPSAVSSLPPPTPASSIPRPPAFHTPSPYTPSITNSKLPHILSDSSVPSTPSAAPAPSASKRHSNRFSSTYATTPSQASSVWDWENFYPPSPPSSDFFNQLKEEEEKEESPHAEPEENNYHEGHHLPQEDDEGDNSSVVHDFPHGHYDSSSSSSTKSDCDEEEERYSRSESTAPRSDFGGSSSLDVGARVRPAPSESGSTFTAPGKSLRRERSEFRSNSAGWNGRDDCSSSVTEDLRLVVRHRDLAEIVSSLEEYFAKASAAGEPVSDLLEIGRAQLERSFRHLKKTVYHSNSVLSAISSSWSSKPPLAIRYQLDTGTLEKSGVEKSHASTLERLFAWEKKLYEEVKAREGVKIEHEKKLSSLQSQEYRGKDDAKLDKTKASINKLQSLIIVTSQAVSTTSSAIAQVRDNELVPQVVDLCFGYLSMWRSMNQFHEIQNHIVQQVRGLIHRPLSGQSTSDLHRVATHDLEAAVSSWHSSFNRLIKFHREYICALHAWVKLTLLPVSSDGPQKQNSSPIAIELTAFCDEWKQALAHLPDTVASEAIKSFMNVVHVISTKQEEELKVKKRAEAYSRELEKKSTALRNIERKYYQSYSMVGVGIAGGDGPNGQVLDARDPLAEKKSEIAVCRRKVEDEMVRHAKAVEVTKSMTLNNIQTGLPGVFQAMTGFSGLFAEVLQGVCRRAGSVK
ncbi:uncharacterized protein LOC110021926 [Phalaenopsis equestris]|uniref:uncharacterized protein LOC110021926 n=1 Tax=Phalaenopsis equestris TaxID=78828 RepID=UPI0009E281DB|nr:uncharacterized protein LOC110021926 [Phalaenopsis equestris]